MFRMNIPVSDIYETIDAGFLIFVKNIGRSEIPKITKKALNTTNEKPILCPHDNCNRDIPVSIKKRKVKK